MPEEVRKEILQILYQGLDDQAQAFEEDDLVRLLGKPWHEIRPDVEALQADGFIHTKERHVNNRIYHFFAITPEGVKFLERPSRPGLIPINIFISSPGDVEEERNAATRVIQQMNNLSSISNRYVLRVLRYEDSAPGEIGHPPQTTVNRYMLEASHADIFIGILCQRMGTPTLDENTKVRYQSGTEYEFMSAYRSNQQDGKPYILLYRGVKPLPENLDREQWDQVNAFFKRFEGMHAELKGLPKTYTTAADFERSLLLDLDTLIANNDFSS